MSFLLDTNVVSEWVKPAPNPGLMAWARAADEESLFLSVVSLAELRSGAERLPSGRRRDRLEQWLGRELLLRFQNRILFVNLEIADVWGRIVSRCSAVGKPISAIDGFLAATALVHSLTLVTRNVQHFSVLQSVLNPWT